MHVEAFTHFGICVADLDRSLAFYCRGLGFEQADLVGQVEQYIDPLVELDDVVLEFRFLTRDGMSLELLHFVSPGTVGTPERRPMNQLGLTHLGLRVDDVDAAAQRIVAMGGRVYPHTRVGYQVGDQPPIDSVYCTDPDGVRLELIRQELAPTGNGA
ncbi:MAG: VOC family protein [Acidimicrobiales bacterium]|jgi:catechol 2,3-dioxygenase-like lactoylglutathione lyase family enzyme